MVLSVAPWPMPRLDTHTAAVPVAVLVWEIVSALVEPVPPARPSMVKRSAPARRRIAVVDEPLIVRIDTPARGRIVTDHGPPLDVTGPKVIGKVSPVVPL